jgi:hypothetical protein
MSPNLKLDLSDAPEDVMSHAIEAGDVYSKAGGGPGFWVVVAIRGQTCYVLAFDIDGEVTGAQSYTLKYFLDRDHRYCGRVEIPHFNVDWTHRRIMR